MMEEYQKLLTKIKEIAIIEQIGYLLGWDTEVMMPRGAVKQRSEQSAFISKLSHDRLTDPEIGELLEAIEKHSDYEKMSLEEKRNVYLVRREYDRAVKVPSDFVAEFSKACVLATEAWKEAREKNDFSIFQPHLEKVFEMARQYATFIDPNKDPYDVLLDIYEPGMTKDKYEAIFGPLKEETIKLLKKCVNAPKKPNVSLIMRKVPLAIQEQLSRDVMPLLGYDLNRGRLNVSAHPFTTGQYDDVRITTRYRENDFASSFFAVMHESGHACYEQNQKDDWRYLPIGTTCSMGIHESQSRFYENIIGRSRYFWKFYYPRFQEITGSIFSDLKLDDFLLAINRVEPSLIRVEADEVTYNLHIILRFELEKGLFDGKITIAELPSLWKEKMKEYLGVDVPTDSVGVLQDIHWSGGTFGYFPTYSLGNVYGAQFFTKLKKDIPNWAEELEKGNVGTLTNWLKKNIHEKGNLYDPPELVKEVTGEEPNPKYLIDYLTEKYSELYGF